MSLLYNLSIIIYHLFIRVAALFNAKARQWVNGRAGIWENISGKVNPEDQNAWFHVSSLGEFEQGRSLIEAFRKKHPEYKIVLTFFSPSGYEVRKNYEYADAIFYLPIDTPGNALKFVNLVNPSIAFFVKYDFWFNYIRCLAKKNIPLLYASALFRENQYFFKWYGGWFRKHLKYVTHFYVQNTLSEKLLKSIGITQVSVCGDTRFDRVYSITQNVKPFPLIQKFCNNSQVFICGSTWPPDEEILIPFINTGYSTYKFIIAPHMVEKAHVESIAERTKVPCLLYSEIEKKNPENYSVLIIDCIGILSNIYQYAHVAYIGGGFGSSIHNIQEPATFGMPILFGPNYHKFREAVELIAEGGAFCIHNPMEFENTVKRLMNNPDLVKHASYVSKEYIKRNIGATDYIIRHLEQFI